MEQLSPAGLELGSESHEELIEASSLLMPTATGAVGACDRGGYSVDGTLWWREGINLPPKLTEAAVELVDGLISLLKSTQCLVQSENLSLAGHTVAPGEICPHSMCRGKLSNLGPDPRGDRLADHQHRRGVICVPFLRLLLEGVEENRRDRRRSIPVSDRGLGDVGEVGSCGWQCGPLGMTQEAEPVEDATNRELPKEVIGAIKDRVGVVEVAPR